MSRLYRIGTVYSRIEGVLKKQCPTETIKPIWFDVYTHFPPKYEPTYGRPAPKMEVKQIFYPEDKLRAVLHKTLSKKLGTVDFDSEHETNSQKWIRRCTEYMARGMSEEEAIEKLQKDLKHDTMIELETLGI